MGKLIMVRHGESEGNRDRRFNITPDIPITELGALKGESYDVLRELVRRDPAYDPKQGWLWRPERGESYDDVRRRVMVAIEGLRERYPQHEVVVVSHGGVMLSMWAHLVGRCKDAHLPANCGIVIVEHDRDRFYPPKIVEP